MSDQLANGPMPRPHKVPRSEFRLYFAVIFLLALPTAAVGWALTAARLRRLPEHGPVARAWAEAQRITPLIFSA